jgi:GntR family transcriptional regulator
MVAPLTTDSSEPLFKQLFRRIADDVASGRLGPGDRLPSERALLEELQVSRATIRRALHELVAEGLVDVSPGRGWFVRAPTLSEPPRVLMSITELGARYGLDTTAEVLGQAVRPATLDEAEAFAIAPGAEVFELCRLRMFDGVPVAVDHSRVPLARAPGLPDVDFTTASLMATLDASGAGPVRADYVTEAGAADPFHAEHLGVEPGSPVFIAVTTSQDADGRVVELTKGIYRSDRYRFRTTLLRRTAS